VECDFFPKDSCHLDTTIADGYQYLLLISVYYW